MAMHHKGWKPYEDLLEIIESRGLLVRDRDACLLALQHIGYYRLSAYWYPFRYRPEGHIEGQDTPADHMIRNITLDDIIATYEIDRCFRQIIFDAVERIEIALRVAIANQLGQFDTFAFDNQALFDPGCNSPSRHRPELSNFQAFITQQIERTSRSSEEFVKHHTEKYDGKMPVWVAIEVWDFGTLLDCYRILRSEDKEAISGCFGIPGTRILSGWIECLRILRNSCAHHSRLNRRHFTNVPRFPGKTRDTRFNHFYTLEDRFQHRLYAQLLIIADLLGSLHKREIFATSVIEIVKSLDDINCVEPADYGFPENWLESPLWSINS